MCPNAIYHRTLVYKPDLVQVEKEMPQMMDVLVPTPEGAIQILGVGGEGAEEQRFRSRTQSMMRVCQSRD